MARIAGNRRSDDHGDLKSVTRGYRNRDNAGPQSKPAFRDLQAYWYGKLRAEGFKDIEGCRDTNKLNTSTLPGDRFVFEQSVGSAARRESIDGGPVRQDSDSGLSWALELNARLFGTGELATSDLPQAKAWRALSVAAHELPQGWRGVPLPVGWNNRAGGSMGGRLPVGHPGGRAFIIDVCQTGCIPLHLLQRHKLTRGWARKLWRDFVAQAKMPEAQRLLVKGNVKEPEDA